MKQGSFSVFKKGLDHMDKSVAQCQSSKKPYKGYQESQSYSSSYIR